MRRRVTKYAAYFLLAILFVSAWSAYLLVKSKIPQFELKKIIEHELSKALNNQPVHIQSLKGGLVNQVILENVQIGDAIVCKTIEANYDLVGTAQQKGDILANLSSIVLDQPTIRLIRDNQGEFNLAKLVASGPEGAPLTLKGKIIIKDATLYYSDAAGWYGRGLSENFQVALMGLNGTISFANNPTINIVFKGQLHDRFQQTPIFLAGDFNLNSGFGINLDVPQLDLRILNNYAFPDIIQIEQGQAFVKLFLGSSTALSVKGELPIDLKLNAFVENGLVSSTLLGKEKLEQVEGQIVIDKKGFQFSAISFKFLDTPWNLQGSLAGYDHLELALAINTPQFELNKLAYIIPVSGNFLVQGKGETDLKVQGYLDDPELSVSLRVPKARLADYNFSDILADLSYKNKLMDFKVNQLGFARGVVRAEGQLSFAEKAPDLKLEINFKNIVLPEFVPSPDLLKGVCSGQVLLKGPFDYLFVGAKIYSTDALIAGQKIAYAELNARVTPQKITFVQNALNLNQTAVFWTGELISGQDFKLSLNSKGLKLTNKQFRSEGVLAFTAQLSGKLSAAFYKAPLTLLQGQINLVRASGKLFGQQIDNARANIGLNNQVFKVNKLELESGSSSLHVEGTADLRKQIDIKITGRNVDLNSLEVLKQFLPEQMQSISGIGEISLKVKGDLAVADKSILEKIRGQGDLSLRDFTIFEQPLTKMDASLVWNGESVEIEGMSGQVGESQFKLKGSVGLDQRIDITIAQDSVFRLEDFRVLFHDIGDVRGLAKVFGTVKGTISKPQLSLDTAITSLQINDFQLDSVIGNIVWQYPQLRFNKVSVVQAADSYKLDGVLNFSGQKDQDFNFRVKIPTGDMKVIASLIDNVAKEISRQKGNTVAPKPGALKANTKKQSLDYLAININDLASNNNELPLYSHLDNSNTVLSRVQSVHQAVELNRSPQSLGFAEQFRGQISGQLDFSRANEQINAQADFVILNGALSGVEFQKMNINAETKAKGVNIKLELNEGRLAGGAFKKIETESLYDQYGWLRLNKFDMSVNGHKQSNILIGDIPIEAFWNPLRVTDSLNVKLQLDQDSVGILAIFNPVLEEIKNKGKIYLKITGPLISPVFNGQQVELKDAEIIFNKSISLIKSPFKIDNAVLNLKDNVVYLNNLGVHWKGSDTSEKDNNMIINGKFELAGLNLTKLDRVTFNMDLSLKNMDLALNLPTVYMGKLKLENIALRGPFIVPISALAKQQFIDALDIESETGPLLSGSAILYEGRIPLPESSVVTLKPGIRLSIEANIGEDVFVSRANLNSGADLVNNLVGNIDFQLTKTKTPLLVEGSLNTPAVEGSVVLEEGSLSALLKQFSLVKKELKKKYFSVRDDIKDNIVKLTMVRREEGKVRRKLQPSFQVVASTVADIPQDIQDATNTKNVTKTFLVKIDGPLTDIRSLSFARYSYSVNDSFQPVSEREYKLINDDGSTIDYQQLQELYYALMPSLIKDLPEILSEGFGSTKSKELIQKYTATQTNVWAHSALRPYEKQIARSVGLYDLKIIRNFGEDFTNLVGLENEEAKTNETDKTSEPDKLFGLDLMQELIKDRVFIAFNTEVYKDILTNNFNITLSSYKLTISLLRNLLLDDISINFQDKISAGSTVEKTFSIEAENRF